MRKWRCKNCEHINTVSDNSCEICESSRAYFRIVKYELTGKLGVVILSWNSVDAEEVYIIKKKKKIKVDLSGSYTITECKHKEIIIFYAKNKIADYYEELTVLLEKPEIVFFELESTKLLLGRETRINWDVRNSERIRVSEIGVVENSGTLTFIFKKSPITITAKNELGVVEKGIHVDFIPLPIVKYSTEKAKVEMGDSVKLSWSVDNATRVHLSYDEKKEEVPFDGTKILTLYNSSIFKIIVTALDNITFFEEELSVQVVEKPIISFFNVTPNVVLDCIPVTLSWNVENAKKVVIDNGVGEVEMVGTKKTLLHKNKTMFKLTAYGELSNCEQEVFVRVFPTPIIESLKVPMPVFESSFNLSPIVLNPPKINVSINLPDFNFSVPEYITPNISLNRIKPKYNSKTSIFNFSKLYGKIRSKIKK